jgi:hypothetical protein
MKLRIHGNSIRFRIGQSEVTKLLSEGRLAETVQLTSSDSFAYVLETSSQCKEVRAWRSDFKIGVSLPEQLARSWGTSSQVGIEQTQPIGETGFLRIVVEKDFACLHPGTDANETEWDSFSNPNTAAEQTKSRK